MQPYEVSSLPPSKVLLAQAQGQPGIPSQPVAPDGANAGNGSLTGAAGNLFAAFTLQQILTLGGCLAVFALLAWLGSDSKTKLATAHFGSTKEKAASRKRAGQQIAGRKRNAVSVYVGMPRRQHPDPKTLYLTDAQRGIAICGGPGSGKTFSVIDPALRSVVDQGFPLILYDFKYPTQSSRLIGYAAKCGYNVRIFAPGFPESDVCNPLDFLRDESDAETARQIAIVMGRNFRPSNQGKGDPFFDNAGDQLAEAVLMLAKGTRFPDLMMCQSILSLPKLPDRLEAANLNPWVRSSFGQLISVKDSEKTVGSIIGVANSMFTGFMKPSVLPAFCGSSTLPLDLKGKQLLVIGMDRERRDVVSPLVASILHMLVSRNVSTRRSDPLVVSLDELPTLYLPSLVQWLNENREDGLCCMLGFQNFAQIEERYGRELSRAIFGGCATKAIFNPGESESARTLSDMLGEEEIRYKSKSRNRGSGKGSASTTISQQERTRKLYAPDQFLRLPPGKCILLSPGFSTKEESSIPIEQKVKIPKRDIAISEASEAVWEKVREQLVRRSTQGSISLEARTAREQLAAELFPLPAAESPRKPPPLDPAKFAGLL